MDDLDKLDFKQLRCPSCGLADVEVSLYRDHFMHGDESEPEPDKQVELSAIVLVQHCRSCKQMWTDEAATAARDAAVRIHQLEIVVAQKELRDG